MAVGWLAQVGAEDSQNTRSREGDVASPAAPTIEAGMLMHALMAGVIGTVATTTTTTPGLTGAVGIMAGRTADGVPGSDGVGDGAERLGTVSMAITSTRIPFTQRQHFGLLII